MGLVMLMDGLFGALQLCLLACLVGVQPQINSEKMSGVCTVSPSEGCCVNKQQGLEFCFPWTLSLETTHVTISVLRFSVL